MYEVTVRDMPAPSLLSVIRRPYQDELVPMGRELFIQRLRGGGVPRIEGVAGAPFLSNSVPSATSSGGGRLLTRSRCRPVVRRR